MENTPRLGSARSSRRPCASPMGIQRPSMRASGAPSNLRQGQPRFPSGKSGEVGGEANRVFEKRAGRMEGVDAFLQRSNRVALAASAEVATASEPMEAMTFLRGGASLALAAKRKGFPARPRGPAPRAGRARHARERRSGRGGLTAALADELESTGRAGRRWQSFGILAASPFRFLLDRLLAPTLRKGTCAEPCSQSPDPSPPSGAGPTKVCPSFFCRR